MTRLVAFLALLAGALALRRPEPLAGEAGGAAAAALSRRPREPPERRTRRSGPSPPRHWPRASAAGARSRAPRSLDGDREDGEIEPDSEPEPEPATKGLVWVALRGGFGGGVFGGLVGGLVPMGAQGIEPEKDAAINGVLLGMATGVFELLYQSYKWWKNDATPAAVVLRTAASAISGACGGVVVSTLAAVIKKAAMKDSDCDTQQVQENFDLDAYISAPWYPQWQNPQSYQESDELSCTSAVYTKPGKGSWDVSVNNTGAWTLSNQKSKKTADNLCAKQQEGAKLVVAPCWLLPSMGGPYWVIKYTEGPGLAHAVIIGGQPNKRSDDGSSCGYKKDMDNGMWIFTRQRVLSPGQEVELAVVKTWMKDTRKLDTSKLLRTPQHDCR